MLPLRRCAWALAPLLACLLLVVGAEPERQLAAREGVFVGYKEVGVEGGATSDEGAAAGGDAIGAAADELAKAGDGSLNAAGGDQAGAADSGDQAGAADSGAAADAGAAAGAAAAGGGDHGGGATAQQEALAAAAGVVGRTVVLHTQFGPIRVKLLEQLAPKTTALVWQLAQRRGCRDCAFYRNEGKPATGFGPPYALLQGRLPDMAEAPPQEGLIEVKMGHACFIRDTKDFFIAYGDHPEWGTAHTVWGLVDEWFATDFIISQQWSETTHPEFGTVMRVLKQEVTVRAAVEGDTTYSGLLGPMHYD